jgi:GR25 family glycosyltransferase involved in LPS biosynthesis
MLPELIKKVYVINLKSCVDRKEHIIEEFKNLNINEYDFFEAIDKDSEQVSQMMKTNFVKKFPPCFRCGKNRCNCYNNVLIKHQVGNWCSFINLMKQIIKNNHKDLIMICEDDIKFTENGMNIIQKMININNFKKYNININEPILIRMGSGYNNNHTLNIDPKFTKQITMSNPCFIINTLFAHSFITHLKEIFTTSDGYIHDYLPKKDKSIQDFTIIPQPIYELSCGQFKKFKSEIHPKGLDKEDKIREKTHFRRIEYDDYLKNLQN